MQLTIQTLGLSLTQTYETARSVHVSKTHVKAGRSSSPSPAQPCPALASGQVRFGLFANTETTLNWELDTEENP
jgi:hypothetical protein